MGVVAAAARLEGFDLVERLEALPMQVGFPSLRSRAGSARLRIVSGWTDIVFNRLGVRRCRGGGGGGARPGGGGAQIGVGEGEVKRRVLNLAGCHGDLVSGDAAEAPEEESDALGEGPFQLAFGAEAVRRFGRAVDSCAGTLWPRSKAGVCHHGACVRRSTARPASFPRSRFP